MAKELNNKKMWESILNPKYHSEVMDALIPHIKDALKDQGFRFDGEHIVSIKPEFKIEAGKWYVCIKPCLGYTVGKIYEAVTDDFIITDNGVTSYNCSTCLDCFHPATEEEIAARGQISGQKGGQKPKFKVGDRVIGRVTNNEPRQISEITDQYYKSTYGGQYGFSFEDEMHLWTIQDAKDGDVLFTSSTASHETFVFKNIDENGNAECYFAYDSEDGFREGKYHFIGSAVNCKPATKEQYDTLMKVMIDRGYTFDFKKKELKKIEQKPAEWSEEDEDIIEWLIGYLEYQIMNATIIEEKNNCLNAISMLKSLKDRYTWKPSDLPHWQKSNLPNNNTTGFNSDYFCHKGYCINYKELFEKLPKDD